MIAVDELGHLAEVETRDKGLGRVEEVVEVTGDGAKGRLVNDAELRLMEARRRFKCGICVGQVGHEDGRRREVRSGSVVGDAGGVEYLEGMIGGIGGVSLRQEVVYLYLCGYVLLLFLFTVLAQVMRPGHGVHELLVVCERDSPAVVIVVLVVAVLRLARRRPDVGEGCEGHSSRQRVGRVRPVSMGWIVMRRRRRRRRRRGIVWGGAGHGHPLSARWLLQRGRLLSGSGVGTVVGVDGLGGLAVRSW